MPALLSSPTFSLVLVTLPRLPTANLPTAYCLLSPDSGRVFDRLSSVCNLRGTRFVMDLLQTSTGATTPVTHQSNVLPSQSAKQQPWKHLVGLQYRQNIRHETPEATFANVRVLNELDTKGVSPKNPSIIQLTADDPTSESLQLYQVEPLRSSHAVGNWELPEKVRVEFAEAVR